ncbi:MAG: hypothetical protein HY847_08555 [Betaproteobacteria bacterium]|nr:hypothetical protein [Betaproteobacteria bacterium]
MKFQFRPAVLKFGTELLRIATDARLFLVLVALAYIGAYLGSPAAPGSNPAYPEGWWGWFDQGNYLKSAQAFAGFDFAPIRHFYPPLYSALGALFLGVSAMHPFWLIDLACLVWFAWTFSYFARRYVPQWVAVLIFLLTIVASHLLLENFVIPWTTTLSAALLSVGLRALADFADSAKGSAVSTRSEFRTISVSSLALGLIAIVRPLDAIVGGILWLGIFVSAWKSAKPSSWKLIRNYLIALFAIFIGPLLFILFNQLVFGSPFGGYIRMGASNGYFLSDIAEKFVSIFLDGYTLYLEPKSGLLDHYPWLTFALPALAFVLLRGDFALRVVAAAVCAQFVLYLPYGDLLPTGLWRYYNIHYFKWTFPYLALFACYAGMATFRTIRTAPAYGVAWLAFFAIVASLLVSLRTEVEMRPLQIHLATNPATVPSTPGTELVIPVGEGDVDLIDLNGVRGAFFDIYFGTYGLAIDGRELKIVHDYRVLQAPWGVRILFIRPVRGKSIIFRLDQRLNIEQKVLAASSGNYHFRLGRPKPFWSEADAIPSSIYSLGRVIDFSTLGEGTAYSRVGWSTPEEWGCWSIDDQASLRFKLRPTVPVVNVELRMSAYVNERHPEQRVIIEANGNEVMRLVFSAKSGSDFRRESFTVPLDADGELKLNLRTPNAVSPAKLGLSKDSRTLGVALVSLSIKQK